MSWTLKIVNGDIVRTQGGIGYEIVEGRDKLVQDCKMILSTDIRADGIGGSLRKVIGKTTDGGAEIGYGVPLMFEFQMMVRGAIMRYRNRQRSVQFNRRSFDELLNDYSPVYVYPDTDDPRKFKWRVDFFTNRGFADFTLGGTSQR